MFSVPCLTIPSIVLMDHDQEAILGSKNSHQSQGEYQPSSNLDLEKFIRGLSYVFLIAIWGSKPPFSDTTVYHTVA